MIIFQNPGLIDLRAITTMGLNAKDTKNPIGQFGTGLKYAIAVCLREGNSFSIWRGEDEYSFFTKSELFRGKSFRFVYMANKAGSPVQLGFTLDLGKNWEIWQALRELESNCRDEDGFSSNNEDWQPSPDTTTIAVSGTSFEVAYNTIQDIFIMAEKPIWESEQLAIYRANSSVQKSWLYYRGVRCQQLEKPAMYRYSLKETLALTEDRTFKHTWQPVAALTSSLTNCSHEAILLNILDLNENTFEDGLDFDRGVEPSESFCSTVEQLGIRCNKSAWRIVRQHRKLPEFDVVAMDSIQQQMLQRAKDFISRMGESRIQHLKIAMASDLGKNKLGLTLGKNIYLSQRVFEMGMKQLVSCLYEEYIHVDRGLGDNNYEMQSFLFDTIISMAAKNMGEIL